ncbi:MAG: class I SAM-dependent methyltransferase [Gemmatimonadaceae bacterium]|nr:class I SAM-dependent methyltransferase [Gemmatimonadaceae bacterium]
MGSALGSVVTAFERRYSAYFGSAGGPPFAISGPDGAQHLFGSGEPLFTLAALDAHALRALRSLDRLVIAESYLAGRLDVIGNLETLLAHRNFFIDSHPLLRAWHFLQPKISGQTKSDAMWISHHYDIEADFFLSFLDTRHRCYSQAIFESDDESLEDAITRKLDFSLNAVNAKPGDRILDIGAGWGAFTQYAGRKGMHVTSLTISRASEKYLNDLVHREQLPCEVRREHLYDHRPDEKYDAIVILGVTEHLPDYDRSLAKYRSLLKPGGKVYLDASAKRRKYEGSSFLLKHIYPGNGSLMCLHDYLRAVAASPFRLESVHDDRHSYALTAWHWADRFDRARAEVERRWGLAQFRKFRLYLWGCYDGFSRDDLQAYRVVLGLPATA